LPRTIDGMRTHTITRAVAGGALLLLAAGGIACSTKADASESAYCKEARRWSAHEMTPRDDADPAVFRPYWQEYLAFVANGTRLSPKPIHDDWAVYAANVKKQTAVAEKYGYDQGRVEREATDAEKAVIQSPGDKVEGAFHEVIGYEALTCSAGQPPAADVSFKGEKPGPYCDVLKTDNEYNQPLRDSGFDPKLVRQAMTDPAKEAERHAIDSKFVSTAPPAIRDDVKAEVAWWHEEQTPVIARYGYDMRKVLLTGSAKEREALQLTDKKVRDHYARALAYEQQVCGA